VAHHEILPSTAHLHWGYLDGTMEPVLRVDPGDTVVIHTVTGGGEYFPGPDFPATVREDHREALEGLHRDVGPHVLTGPVEVRGAEPGDVLVVDIVDVSPRDDWAFNLVRPTAGALPDDFPDRRVVHLGVDRERKVVTTPWGPELPLRPFFGIMATAPSRALGRLTTVPPGPYGGNMDNKELVAGTRLLLPVFEAGALFSAGDGHAVQGDGEVCVTAAETSLVGTFVFDLVKDVGLAGPRARTPTHLVAMGFDEDLESAVTTALRDLMAWMVELGDLDRESAYRLCSLAADIRVTQVVNQRKGVHIMLPVSALPSGSGQPNPAIPRR
jgi:acetamidase/formamidase